MVRSECPSNICTSISRAPDSIAQVANVWRKRCGNTFFNLPQLEVPEQVNAILRNFMARLYQATCRAQGIHFARLLVKMQNPGA